MGFKPLLAPVDNVKASANGAAIQTGRGLEAVCKKIEKEFAKSLAQGATISKPLPPAQHQEPTPQIELYTEQHEERFDKRAKKLTLDALTSSHITTTRGGPIEITVPTETAEELFRQDFRRTSEHESRGRDARR
jgi:hypothetical protein